MADPVTKHCRECGSENIVADAFARWNVETQAWELSSLFDATCCEDCGEEFDEPETRGQGQAEAA